MRHRVTEELINANHVMAASVNRVVSTCNDGHVGQRHIEAMLMLAVLAEWSMVGTAVGDYLLVTMEGAKHLLVAMVTSSN